MMRRQYQSNPKPRHGCRRDEGEKPCESEVSVIGGTLHTAAQGIRTVPIPSQFPGSSASTPSGSRQETGSRGQGHPQRSREGDAASAKAARSGLLLAARGHVRRGVHRCRRREGRSSPVGSTRVSTRQDRRGDRAQARHRNDRGGGRDGLRSRRGVHDSQSLRGISRCSTLASSCRSAPARGSRPRAIASTSRASSMSSQPK